MGTCNFEITYSPSTENLTEYIAGLSQILKIVHIWSSPENFERNAC